MFWLRLRPPNTFPQMWQLTTPESCVVICNDKTFRHLRNEFQEGRTTQLRIAGVNEMRPGKLNRPFEVGGAIATMGAERAKKRLPARVSN